MPSIRLEHSEEIKTRVTSPAPSCWLASSRTKLEPKARCSCLCHTQPNTQVPSAMCLRAFPAPAPHHINRPRAQPAGQASLQQGTAAVWKAAVGCTASKDCWRFPPAQIRHFYSHRACFRQVNGAVHMACVCRNMSSSSPQDPQHLFLSHFTLKTDDLI